MPQERLSVRKIREVIRLHFEAGLSNRAVARACQVSNSTVGEYLERAEKAGLTWPLREGFNDEELYRRLYPEESNPKPASDRPMPDWEEVHRELSKRGVTLTLLWQEYREKHPNGYGFTQFRVYYQVWNKAHTNTMHRPHTAGEEMEVDYAGMTVPITNPETGEISKAAVFVATLPASSYTYAEIQPSQELPHWLGGHVRAFSFFGGIPKTICPDNLKSGVKSPNRYEPELNPSYQELAEYYHVAVLPARVRKPRDKAHVENSVQNVERWVLAPLRNRTFFSVGEANRAIAPLVQALNQREMQHLGKSRKELFEELDQPALRSLPERPYEYATWKTAKVNIDYHVAFEGHYYSVPYALVRQEVRIRASEYLVAIFHKGQQIAVHPRSQAQGRFSTRAEHMPSNHKFMTAADGDWFLREAAKIGPQTTAYLSALMKSRQFPQHAYRSCLGILDLARKYNHPQMETACQVLLTANLLSYRDVKAELEHLAANVSETVLPAHENVRGSSYYQ
ncbi:MAG: IS21 family transposase [Chloroflexi bacterium]|nr:IS21 family transposase [Chloroflexota bacterium]